MADTKINVEILKRGKSKIKEVLTFTATSNEIIIQSTKAWINEVMNLTSSSIFTYQITSGNVPKMNTLHDIKSKKWKDLMKSQIPFSQSCYRGQTAVLRQTPNFDWACSWLKADWMFFLPTATETSTQASSLLSCSKKYDALTVYYNIT